MKKVAKREREKKRTTESKGPPMGGVMCDKEKRVK